VLGLPFVSLVAIGSLFQITVPFTVPCCASSAKSRAPQPTGPSEGSCAPKITAPFGGRAQKDALDSKP
jgi:hypothetical protein